MPRDIECTRYVSRAAMLINAFYPQYHYNFCEILGRECWMSITVGIALQSWRALRQGYRCAPFHIIYYLIPLPWTSCGALWHRRETGLLVEYDHDIEMSSANVLTHSDACAPSAFDCA